MEVPKISPSLAVVTLVAVALTAAHLSVAQNSEADILAAHNAARAEVGTKPLVWNKTIEAFAQSYAKVRIADCEMEHSTDETYGENLAGGTGEFSAVDGVKLWLEEKPLYNHDSNKCVGGDCGHYTQVVWGNTTQLGCARVKCQNGWWFVTCNYYPPGNFVGEKPY